MAVRLNELSQALRAHAPDISPSGRTRHHAAVAVVLHPGGDDALRTLLIKRAERPRDPWSGQMAFPGGRKEPGDAHLEATARRETAEELGLSLSETMLLGRLDDVETERMRDMDLSVAPFVYFVDRLAGLRPNHEVAAVVQVGLHELEEGERHAAYYFPLDPLQRAFPSIHYENHVIWGLTYRVLDNLLRVVGGGLPSEDEIRARPAGL